jgi:hypothetical protein
MERKQRRCSIEDCANVHYGRDLCAKHYMYYYRRNKLLVRSAREPNDIISKGDVGFIKVRNKKQKLIATAIIDKEDIARCSNFKWSKNNDYIATYDGNLSMYLHNFILNRNGDRVVIVDHENRNKCDYRKKNLRICTHSDNHANTNVQKNNTSGFKGVYRLGVKWCSQVRKDGKNYYLGLFSTKIDAAKAYNKKALELFGEFAAPNIINKKEVQ